MLREQMRLAARALWAHRFRSALTVLSITIGAFGIVFMSSLAESGLRTLKRSMEDLGGARLVLVVPKEPERAEARQSSYEPGFTRVDYERLFIDVPFIEEHAMYAAMGAQDVTADDGKRTRTDLVAADPRFFSAYRMPLARGRTLTDEDERAHAKVCVVGQKVAEKLFPGGALGRHLSIAGIRCLVVGELADSGRFGVSFGFDWVDLVIVPLETAGDVLPETATSTLILAKTDDPRHNDVVKRIINARLLERHQGVDDFTLYDMSGSMKKFYAVFATMQAIVGLLAGIALLIGGVGVMNTMLVAVSERVREIGIRKALGARPSDIRTQFLVEALLLAATGGAVGVAFGALAATGVTALIASSVSSWVGGVSWSAVTVALVVSLLLGLLFGWLPARRAGALDPVEAIRR